MTYEDGILNTIRIQHFINGMCIEVERVVYVRLIALSVSWQIDEHESQVFLITESLELLLPCVHITAEAVNETDGFSICLAIHYLIMYANTVIDSDVFRLQFTKCLWFIATIR